MSLTKSYLINGPNNIIRIENNEKILYIMGDIHLEFNEQQECNLDKDYESLNIDQFLVKFFKMTNDEYDLFLETQYNWIDNYKNNYKYPYLHGMRQLFSKNMIFKNNKIQKSNLFPNIRFHYFDFRFDINEYTNITKLCNKFPDFYDINFKIDDIIDYISRIKKEIINFRKNINKKSNNKFIYKLYNNYNDKNIQKKIINIIDTYYIGNIYNLLISTLDELLNYIYDNYDLIKNKYLSSDLKININVEIIKKIDIIRLIYFYLFELTDLYLIKRILDKNYIKKSIIYTGVAHLGTITYFLVKHFDFKITDLFYLDENIKDIQNFEILIKNDKLNLLDMCDLLVYYKKNNKINQCINLFNFPNNFS